ncbi:MAG TPA: pirin-like C-terminal cupin domain-containing protein [Gemmatimonadaceae bacterium]|nr:pirin-like C-terminal cupin domain-containing protein [Gemmatimonadaceae bacterium]
MTMGGSAKGDAGSGKRDRGVGRVVTTAAPSPGFIGEGHTAVAVVDPNEFVRNDPFIVLMDDRIDLEPGREAGGAHPHGGFETVTFVVEGELRDRDEGTLRTGDLLWMTAGSGVIHNEKVVPLGKSRILQLWLTLPQSERWAAPRFEHIARDDAPVRREPGVEARVYSGESGSVRGTAHNYVPVTLVDLRLEPGASFEQGLPDSYNGFLYVLDGAVSVGAERTRLSEGQVGWLAGALVNTSSGGAVRITAGDDGARLVLYAGERQGVPIVMHGPFVGESRDDIRRLSKLYTEGRMPRISELGRTESALPPSRFPHPALEATSGNRN